MNFLRSWLSSSRKQLEVSATEGRVHLVCRLLDSGANADEPNKMGWTPLHQAVWHGHLDVVQALLIRGGANPDAANNSGSTPLSFASSKGRYPEAKLLLSHGADVNAADIDGSRPLDFACSYGHSRIAALLLRHQANVNSRDNRGQTPLHLASSGGHEEIVKLLLQNGANVNATDAKGCTSARIAREKGHKSIVIMLQMEEKDDAVAMPLPEENEISHGVHSLLCPSLCSISFQQLMDVHKMASEKFKASYPAMTMRDVNERIIKPVCKASKTSYALHLNPDGLMLDAFITHSWDEPFAEFVESIRKAFAADFEKPNLWICAFALIQGNSDVIAQQIDVPLDESPFVRALRDASLFVVARNPVTDLYSRIWCVCELLYAKKLGLVPRKTRVIGPDAFSNLHTSIRDAQATNPKDREKILAVLSTEFELEEIDILVQKFRQHEFR